MKTVVKRLHIYLGLLSFTHFLVYGIAGLTAAAQTSRERPKQAHTVRFVPFAAGPMLTDKQVAAQVYQTLDLPFTRPMPDWFLRRTPDHRLQLDFYNINGIFRVIVLEDQGRLGIENIRNNPWLFLEDIHATTGEAGDRFRLIRLWGFYNEFAMWTLIGMTLSGVYLWLASRPKLPWAWICFGGGAATFALAYLALR